MEQQPQGTPEADSLCIVVDTSFFLNEDVSVQRVITRLADATGERFITTEPGSTNRGPGYYINKHVLVVPAAVYDELKGLENDFHHATRIKEIIAILDANIQRNRKKKETLGKENPKDGSPTFWRGAIMQSTKTQSTPFILEFARSKDTEILSCAYYFHANEEDEKVRANETEVFQKNKQEEKRRRLVSQGPGDARAAHRANKGRHQPQNIEDAFYLGRTGNAHFLHNFHKTRTVFVTDDLILQIKSKIYNIECLSSREFKRDFLFTYCNRKEF
ncbi:PIN domain containing protein, putative [Angomonas deanei]|uniref:PIN domain containing protein, putative n=1 Tax=Angomonas deanei TaxID=59799 RepID=A0A7G2C1M2_9TRYP|nr:PIN domain containing protein, putative [Angomonas deanei]